MHADFREGVPRELATRFLVDELAETVEEAAFAIFDACAVSLSARPSAANSRMRVREHRDADPEFLDLGARSKTSQAMPRWWRSSASFNPQMPPPTIAMPVVVSELMGVMPPKSAPALAGLKVSHLVEFEREI